MKKVQPADFHCLPEDRCEPRMQGGNNGHARVKSEQNDEPDRQSRKVIGVLYCLYGDVHLCGELG